MPQYSITIAGAGIGGLTAAIVLADAGHKVSVYEAVPELKPLGVGINLLPHAGRYLAQFGVLDTLLGQGIATRSLGYYAAHGQHIWTEPRGKYAGLDTPQVSLSRGALQMTLLEAAAARIGREQVITGARLTGFATEGDSALAHFAGPDGAAFEVTSDILICADGIHSAARHQLYPDEGAPVYSGRVLWRATSRAKPFLTGDAMIMAGHQDRKFVCYPIEPVGEDGLQTINWIAERPRAELRDREDWNRPGDPADFAPFFSDWRFDWLDVPRLIDTAEAIFEYPLVDRDPVERWTDGRVTLLGDAAHPMYPIGSNGASQAILDTEAMVRALSTSPTAQAALLAYEAERLPATAAIVRANRQNGPEQCMQLAHDRAPNGFDDLSDIFAPGELQEIADRYKQLTGLKKSA